MHREVDLCVFLLIYFFVCTTAAKLDAITRTTHNHSEPMIVASPYVRCLHPAHIFILLPHPLCDDSSDCAHIVNALFCFIHQSIAHTFASTSICSLWCRRGIVCTLRGSQCQWEHRFSCKQLSFHFIILPWPSFRKARNYLTIKNEPITLQLSDPFYVPACNVGGYDCGKVLSSSYAHILSHWGLVPRGHVLDLSLATSGFFIATTISFMYMHQFTHQFCNYPFMCRNFSLQHFFRLPIFPVHSCTTSPSPRGIRVLCVLLRVSVVRPQVCAGRDVSSVHVLPLHKFFHVRGLRVRMERC